MKIKTVEYSKTFNMGNYESLRVGLVAEVEPGDTEQEVLASLNKRVHALKETLSSKYREACNLKAMGPTQAKKLGHSTKAYDDAVKYLAAIDLIFSDGD